MAPRCNRWTTALIHTFASSCWATGDALSRWQGSPVCLKGDAHSVRWMLGVCVCRPPSLCPFRVSYQPSFTTEQISRVKFHPILNKNPIGIGMVPPNIWQPTVPHAISLLCTIAARGVGGWTTELMEMKEQFEEIGNGIRQAALWVFY